jgi:hypothetical protein
LSLTRSQSPRYRLVIGLLLVVTGCGVSDSAIDASDGAGGAVEVEGLADLGGDESPDPDAGAYGDGDAAADMAGEASSDVHSVGDGDGDGDADGDAALEADIAPDSQTGADADAASDSDSQADTNADDISGADSSGDSVLDSETVVDTDTAVETVVDSDADADTDADADVAGDSAVEIETAGDVDSGGDAATEIEPDSAMVPEVDSDSLPQPETDAESDSDSDSGPDIEVDLVPEADLGPDTEADSMPEPDADAQTDADSAADSDAQDTAPGPDVCVPDCLAPAQCGDDGCGGVCGTCDPDATCVDTLCRLGDGAVCSGAEACLHRCIAGFCAAESPLFGPCDDGDSLDCAAGLTCAEQVCLRPEGAPCAANEVCAENCIQAVCAAPSEAGGPCDLDDLSDCADGLSCFESRCVWPDEAACTANIQCISTCLDGLCAPLSAFEAPCDAGEDEDCEAPLACGKGFCLWPDAAPCADNDECASTCLGGVCAPSAGGGAACDAGDSADCVAGAACLGGTSQSLVLPLMEGSVPLSGAVSGDRVLLSQSYRLSPEPGSPRGAAWVFERGEAGEWSSVAQLEGSPGVTYDWFGWSVALDGDVAIVGAPLEPAEYGEEFDGRAYVFERHGDGSWSEGQPLDPLDRDWSMAFGWAVGVSQGTLVVGSDRASSDGESGGEVYLFGRAASGLWLPQDRLLEPDPGPPRGFGKSVALMGARLLVGAPGRSARSEGYPVAALQGGVHVYERHADGAWQPVQILAAADGWPGDGFGCALAVDVDRALVGNCPDSSQEPPGAAVYAFSRASDGAWVQTQRIEVMRPPLPSDDWIYQAGASLALRGERALVTSIERLADGGDKPSVEVLTWGADGLWVPSAQIHHPALLAYDLGRAYVGVGTGLVLAGSVAWSGTNSEALLLEDGPPRCAQAVGAACADNGMCVGTCIDGTCAAPAAAGDACDPGEDSDCAPGLGCGDAVCAGGVGAACQANPDCAGTCIQGTCAARRPFGGACDPSDDADCAVGLGCGQSVCLLGDGAACGDNGECVTTCLGGVCAAPSGQGGPCDPDDSPDCAAHLECAGATCLTSTATNCERNAECAATCVLGECEPLSAPGAICDPSDTEDCASGNRCIGRTVQAIGAPYSLFPSGFGAAVAISGDFALVGAPRHPHPNHDQRSGAVFAYRRDVDGVWRQSQMIVRDDLGALANFGEAVVLSGSRALVAAKKASSSSQMTWSYYPYTRDAEGQWSPEPPLAFTVTYTHDGSILALEADRALVEQPGASSGLAVNVAERQPNGAWTLAASFAAHYDGLSASPYVAPAPLALSGLRVLVGAPSATVESQVSGAAHIVERTPGGAWLLAATLAPSASGAGFRFGTALDLHGDQAIVASKHVAFIFERQPDATWLEVASLYPALLTSPVLPSSIAVALTRDRAVVIAWLREYAESAGTVAIYNRDASGIWSLAESHDAPAGAGWKDALSPYSYGSDFNFDAAVDASGSWAVVGLPSLAPSGVLGGSVWFVDLGRPRCAAPDGEPCTTQDGCVTACVAGLCSAASALDGPCDADDDTDCAEPLACGGAICEAGPGAACAANATCAGTCIGNACAEISEIGAPCDTLDGDLDCASGLVCFDGSCLRANGAACGQDAECAVTCIENVCVASSGFDGPCDDSEGGDCAAGLQCRDGRCLGGPGEACADNDACASTCIGGVCDAVSNLGGVCDDSADCAIGLACGGGTCEPSGEACQSNTECAVTCVDGGCTVRSDFGAGCDAGDDGDCLAGLGCGGGVCLLASGEPCGANGECVGTCIGGVCAPIAALGATCDAGDTEDCTAGLLCDARVVQQVQASAGDAGDSFGASVAIWGRLAVIGAPTAHDAGGVARGAAWLFERRGDGTWVEVQQLLASDVSYPPDFGRAVAIRETTILIGAPNHQGSVGPAGHHGAAYVFSRQPDGAWIQTEILWPPPEDIWGGFGSPVVLDDDEVYFRYEWDDGGVPRPSVAVYARQADGTWQIRQTIARPVPGEGYPNEFGASIATFDDRLAIADPRRELIALYEREASESWGEVQTLRAHESAVGIGTSLTMWGDVLVAGAPQTSAVPGVSKGGVAYVFERQDGGGWVETQKLGALGSYDARRFAGTAALWDGQLAVGGFAAKTGNAGLFHLLAATSGAGFAETETVGLTLTNPASRDAGFPLGLWEHDLVVGSVRSTLTSAPAGQAAFVNAVPAACHRPDGASCADNAECAGACIAQTCSPTADVGGVCDGDDDEDCTADLVCEAQACAAVAPDSDGP